MPTDNESDQLRLMAAGVARGCLVILGPSRYQTLVALTEGVRESEPAARRPIFCIDSCAPPPDDTAGNGRAVDRQKLLQAMGEGGACEEISLIDLPLSAISSWHQNIGLLVVDRDYLAALSSVAFEPWIKKAVDGSCIVITGERQGDEFSIAAISPHIESELLRISTDFSDLCTLKKFGASYWSARRGVAEWIRSKAEMAGYSSAEAVNRTAYGSFVSIPNRYVFVETPKAACTSWKRFVAEFEQAHFDDTARPYQRETTPEMLIHQRRHLQLPTLLDLPVEVLEEVWAANSDWFKFAVVRNPFSRLVSVFENKVRLGEPGYRQLEARFGDQAGFVSPREAFAAFVEEVTTNSVLRSSDAHLRPQMDLLMPRLIPYSRIFKMEEMNQAVSILKERANRGRDPIRLPSTNESHNRPWRQYYSHGSALSVASAYAEDFKHFAFDPNDWQTIEVDFNESPAVRIARAKIVQRNAMIECLYDWVIDKP